MRPVFSLDGTRFAFERKVDGASGQGWLYVAKADGSGLTQVTPEPVVAISSYTFSPDGQEILVSAGLEGAKAILVAKADGSAVRTLDVGSMEAIDPIYRAPDGREVIFVGHPILGTQLGPTADGLYAVKPDGSGLRPVVAPTNLLMLWAQVLARWNADRVRLDRGPTTRPTRFPVDPGLHRRRRRRDTTDPAGPRGHQRRRSRRGMVERWHAACSSPAATDPSQAVTDCPSTMIVVPVGRTVPTSGSTSRRGSPERTGPVQVWAPDDGAIVTTPLGPDGLPRGDAAVVGPADGSIDRRRPWNGCRRTVLAAPRTLNTSARRRSSCAAGPMSGEPNA